MKTQRTYINDKDRDQKLIIILQYMNNHMKPSRSRDISLSVYF